MRLCLERGVSGSLVVGAQRFAEIVEYQDRTTPDGGDPFLTVQLPPFLPGRAGEPVDHTTLSALEYQPIRSASDQEQQERRTDTNGTPCGRPPIPQASALLPLDRLRGMRIVVQGS